MSLLCSRRIRWKKDELFDPFLFIHSISSFFILFLLLFSKKSLFYIPRALVRLLGCCCWWCGCWCCCWCGSCCCCCCCGCLAQPEMSEIIVVCNVLCWNANSTFFLFLAMSQSTLSFYSIRLRWNETYETLFVFDKETCS